MHLLIRCCEAGFGLYGQRAPATVLHLTQEIQRLAGERATHALALATNVQVKAFSLLGRNDDALRTLNTLQQISPQDARSDLYPVAWTDDQLQFTSSWIYAGLGDESAADTARERVLTLTSEDYQYVTNVQLHEALCIVTKGGVDEGTQLAANILDGLSPAYRSQMINETGKNVLRAVPPAQRQRPAVRELHEVLQAG